MSKRRHTHGHMFAPAFGAVPTAQSISDRASANAVLEVEVLPIPADQTTTMPVRTMPVRVMRVRTMRPTTWRGGTHE